MNSARRRQVVLWLVIVCLMVLSMVAIGGITRLTESGLSIVRWEPIAGAVPPLNQEAWQAVFDKYRESPQYKLVNRGMSLDEFKRIFFWEYIHRLWGRLIGLVFFVPFVFFTGRGYFDRRLGFKLGLAFILGGLQGLMGWYMVKSGLVAEPRVSHYRLAAHLFLALAVVSYLYWIVLDLREQDRPPNSAAEARDARPLLTRLRTSAFLICGGLLLQILFGAFTAGTRAGHLFNTFPLMGGEWFPAGFFKLSPVFLNLLENQVAIQFVHRALGWALLLGILLYWYAARPALKSLGQALSSRISVAIHALAALVAVQFVLGVATLLLVVPVGLGVLHQINAFILFLAAVKLVHVLSFRDAR